ncbi:nuclear transport factor 2 family protein [Sphingobium xenophagum]
MNGDTRLDTQHLARASDAAALREVRAIERRRMDATNCGGVTTLEAIFGGTLVHVHADDKTDGKAALMERYGEGCMKLDQPEFSAKASSDIAVIHEPQHATVRGAADIIMIGLTLYVTQTLAQLVGSWRYAFFHACSPK